jgi:hypothetical protein
MDLTRAAPQITIVEECSSTKQAIENQRRTLNSTNMEMSIADEPTRALNKTFDAQEKPSALDSTDYDVPNETCSDSVFASGEVEMQITEVESNRRHQSIKSITQRFVDQLNDQSFSTEDTKIVETSKLPKANEILFSQTEDIGEVCIGESGHVSVNVKRVETISMHSPEHNSSKQVDLSNGQELMLSPKAKQLVAIIERSPDKALNRTLSKSMAVSPIVRNFNAPVVIVTLATPDEDNIDPSPPKAVSKERRMPVEHPPVKKHCPDTSVLRSSAKKKDLDMSRRNVSISRGNFEAEFRRCEDFEMSRFMEEAGPSRCVDEALPPRMDLSRRSEMDTSRKNRTFDCSEMSISFLPPETENRPQFSKILDEFDAVLPKKKCSELDVISRRMDEIILWYKQRKESQKVDDKKDQGDVVDGTVEEKMEVEQIEPEVPLTPIAAKLKEMSQK